MLAGLPKGTCSRRQRTQRSWTYPISHYPDSTHPGALVNFMGVAFMDPWGKNFTIQGSGFCGEAQTVCSQRTSVCFAEIVEP